MLVRVVRRLLSALLWPVPPAALFLGLPLGPRCSKVAGELGWALGVCVFGLRASTSGRWAGAALAALLLPELVSRTWGGAPFTPARLRGSFPPSQAPKTRGWMWTLARSLGPGPGSALVCASRNGLPSPKRTGTPARVELPTAGVALRSVVFVFVAPRTLASRSGTTLGALRGVLALSTKSKAPAR